MSRLFCETWEASPQPRCSPITDISQSVFLLSKDDQGPGAPCLASFARHGKRHHNPDVHPSQTFLSRFSYSLKMTEGRVPHVSPLLRDMGSVTTTQMFTHH